jgi:prefoldin subunit 5
MHQQDIVSIVEVVMTLNNQLNQLKQENENLKAQLNKILKAQQELNPTKE